MSTSLSKISHTPTMHEINGWSHDDLRGLSLREIFARANRVDDFLHEQKQNYNGNVVKRYARQVKVARRYFLTVDFSETLRDNFCRVAQYAAQDIFEYNKCINDKIMRFKRLNYDDKKLFATDVLSLIFSRAREYIVEDLETPTLRKGTPGKNWRASGWVNMDHADILKGVHSAIFLRHMYLRTTDPIDLIDTLQQKPRMPS